MAQGRLASATAALVNGDRILLVRRRDLGTWEMPGGFVERGEAPWDAAVRECFEECEVRAEAGPIVGIYHRPRQDLTVFVFQCRYVEGEPSATGEASEAGWFSMDGLPTPMVEVVQERIEDVRLGVPPTYRTQRGQGNADMRDRR